MNKRDAQRRAEQILSFQQEMEILKSEQVLRLSETDRSAVSNYHEELLDHLSATFDTDRTKGQANLSIGMQIASTLGAIAFSFALFLVFENFWDDLGIYIQLGLASLLPFIGLGLTIAVDRIFKTPYYTGLSVIVAIACLVGNILILGHYFNLPDSPNAFLLWGVYGVILSLRYQLAFPFFLSVLSIFTFIGGYITEVLGYNWSHTIYGELYLAPALIIAAACYLYLPARRYHLTPVLFLTAFLVAAVSLLQLSLAGRYSFFTIDRDFVEFFYTLLALGFGGISIAISLKEDWSFSKYAAIGFLILVLLTKYYDWAWDVLPEYVFFLILGIFSIAIIIVLRKTRAYLQGASS
ncbi:DUF2157 domain-containing protein [Sneathiella sp. P13V-1]|uniref:DUF2157 domain-containing protein n=1 Tax=Sneathiella sp. P13V-1 TaxID=2697366 RepID=UPI00187B86CF|nr:DUF2157 domain-containing protein [Sneathiella sp. P13V-1]MBE7635883.1 DUF2157 domain-containing protein [Sneathiella sp. P13V-1]